MKRNAAVTLVALILAGCGGGGHSASSSVPVTTTGKNLQSGTMSLTFGSQTGTASATRKPKFVSPNATTAMVSVNGGTDASFDVSATSTLCTTAGNVRTCAIPISAPVGQDSIAVELLAANAVLLGEGSNSVTVAAGVTFSLNIGINPMAAAISLTASNIPGSGSYTLGTAASQTGTLVFTDPSGATITGSGNVPNFFAPITLTSSDSHITITPTTLTTPGQPFTAAYDGSAAVASSVTVTAKVGTVTLATAAFTLPGLIVTRYALAAINSPGTIFPEQIVVGPDNNIWWTEQVTNRIGRISPGAAVTVAPNPAITYFPNTIGGTVQGLAVGCDGNLWYSNGSTAIGRMTPTGGVPSTGPPNPMIVSAGGGHVGRLASDTQGNIWYVNSGTGFSQVAEVDCTGSFTNHTYGSTPTANALQSFAGLAVGADKAMWFTEAVPPSIHQIGRITTAANGTAGTYGEVPVTVTGSSTYPTDITQGAGGNMWFSVFGSNGANQFSQASCRGRLRSPTPRIQTRSIRTRSQIWSRSSAAPTKTSGWPKAAER